MRLTKERRVMWWIKKAIFFTFPEFQAEHCRCRHERDELRRRTERASDGKTASNDAATQHSREGGERRRNNTTNSTQTRFMETQPMLGIYSVRICFASRRGQPRLTNVDSARRESNDCWYFVDYRKLFRSLMTLPLILKLPTCNRVPSWNHLPH